MSENQNKFVNPEKLINQINELTNRIGDCKIKLEEGKIVQIANKKINVFFSESLALVYSINRKVFIFNPDDENLKQIYGEENIELISEKLKELEESIKPRESNEWKEINGILEKL